MSQQDGAIPAQAAARETAPATLKSAIRRIVRSAIGKRLAMDESQPGATSGFKRVFPIAWAITHLADVQAKAQPHTAMIVRDEEASDGDLRWYSLIPTLMSAHKDWSVAAVVAQFEAGQVFLPQRAPWLPELETELFSFPNGRHDDQVDSISQLLNQRSEVATWLKFAGIR